MLATLFALILVAPRAEPTELFDYLREHNGAAKWTREKVFSYDSLRIQSQTWQGIRWEHDVVLVRPRTAARTDTVALMVTGGKPAQGDLDGASLLANASGVTVAVLFQIPNQPLWDMVEDDLIAHTFEKYLATNDRTWPLLLPMVRSVMAAMDALQSATRNDPNPIRRFVVGGASKRGWTTWLAAATGDRRIAGIVPVVYDNLDIPTQMKAQMDAWGAYSPQIEDYTRRGLQAKLETPEGKRLSALVDPYTYRDRIKAPVLVVNGGNDPYWTVDAMTRYWAGLKMPKWSMIVPNAGHDVTKRGLTPLLTAAAFVKHCAGLGRLPNVEWQAGDGRIEMRADTAGLTGYRLWRAESSTMHFENAVWESVKDWPGESKVSVALPAGRTPRAYFVEARYSRDGTAYTLTSGAVAVPARK